MNGRNMSCRSSANEWGEYEMQLNEVLLRDHDPVICTYDAEFRRRARHLAHASSCNHPSRWPCIDCQSLRDRVMSEEVRHIRLSALQ
jgi:hypothetical protein